jgi:hypothetical protein
VHATPAACAGWTARGVARARRRARERQTSKRKMPSFLLLLLAGTARAGTSAEELRLVGSPPGRFSLTVGGVLFAEAAPLTVQCEGRTFSNADGSLKAAGNTSSSGTDAIGAYHEQRTMWLAGATKLETAVRTYSSCLVFEQHWPDGASGTGGLPGGVIAAYPSLQLAQPEERGFLAFGGRQLEACFAAELTGLSQLPTGNGGGGPVAIFDKNGTTLTVSAASEFMSAACARPSSLRYLAAGIASSFLPRLLWTDT